MHLVNFYLKGREQPLSFRYRDKTEAEKLYARCLNAIQASKQASYDEVNLMLPFFLDKDDSGHSFAINLFNIEHVILVDVGEDLNGAIELQLLQVRAQAAGQRKAQADPALNLGLAQGAFPRFQQ